MIRFQECLDNIGLERISADSTPDDLRTFGLALREQLAGADPLDVDLIRRTVIARLTDVGIPDPRSFVVRAIPNGNGNGSGRTAAQDAQGQAMLFADPDPWPAAVDGAALLEDLEAFCGEFLTLPAGGATLLAAFVVATYVRDAFPAASYLVVHSPVPGCGKTRLLEVLEMLVRRAWRTVVPSTAVLFRVLEQHSPTLLLDEAEVVNAKSDSASDVRALLQAGYRRGGGVPRCVGEDNTVRTFQTFGPKVFALIGELPPALFDRCIPVEMQRRSRGTPGLRFRASRVEAPALELRRRAVRWSIDHAAQLGEIDVPVLEALSERQEEVWEPLLAIGLLVGDGWYERLRDVALAFSGGRPTSSIGVDLLGDIQGVFRERGSDRIWSEALSTALIALEGHRWADWNRGRGITPNVIARMLRDFGIGPGTIRIGDQTAKGYMRKQFDETWAQYLPEYVAPSQPSSSADDLADANRNGVPVSEPQIVADFKPCDVVTGETEGPGARGDAWEPGA